MAGEVQLSYRPGATCYFLVRNNNGQIWNGSAFEVYASANYANYDVALVEQGSASSYFVGNFPTSISAGYYNLTGKQQLGASPAESDPTIGTGDLNWNGTAVVPLSDLATSGQVGQFAPIRVARGTMIPAFPFKMVSAADHITPFTSGNISGQISRDGAAFTVLQSGGFTEIGLGWYRVPLTSGDLLANSVALVFTGVGISGGNADQRDFSFILQKTSGST